MRVVRRDETTPPSPRWPWVVFALAAVWVVATRIPLILNAESHLDSDLAVDGLTLLDFTRGHWRWHYPGTPFMGIGPVLYSLPQALVWGANPVTLASGGTVAYLGLLLATFLLARRAFGTGVACWSLAPLTFGSTGAVWLSGKITGGHLTAALWHAGAFALLVPCLERARRRDWVALGLWSGSGIALDLMFGLTLAGLAPAGLLGGLVLQGRKPVVTGFVLFSLAFLVGVAPRVIGERVDPYNAYRGQFEFVADRELIASHWRILRDRCLPRLIAGHLLPNLESDPGPSALTGGLPRAARRDRASPLAYATTVAAALVLGLACVGMAAGLAFSPTKTGRVVALGLLISAAATLAGFVANRNIYNSDNYRYLVGLLVPYSLGFGLSMNLVTRHGGWTAVGPSACALAFAALMTADLGQWYTGFGWVDGRGRPVRKAADDPTLAWLVAHPEVTWIDGEYWDVYRLSFLTGGRVKGVPFPAYPNRFPRWRPEPGAGRATVVRLSPEGIMYRESALRAGAAVVHRARGVSILVGP